MDAHLKGILGTIDVFGPVMNSTPGINNADTNALKKLGYIKSTKDGWIVTRKGKKALK